MNISKQVTASKLTMQGTVLIVSPAAIHSKARQNSAQPPAAQLISHLEEGAHTFLRNIDSRTDYTVLYIRKR
jgi:hypothetical protein